MNHYVLDFIPPIEGVDGEFNTIRLGLAWAKRLAEGDTVYLMDNKAKRVIGKARVTAIFSDTLEIICEKHGHANHTQLRRKLSDGDASLEVMRVITKIYGPHIAQPKKKATAIYLKRLG